MSDSLQRHALCPTAFLSMGFPRQEYWSGLPFPSSGDLPHPGIETASPALQVGSLQLSHQVSPYFVFDSFANLSASELLHVLAPPSVEWVC